MKFAVIPPGEFMMGSPEDEPGRQADETLHKVTLTQPFQLGMHEVTQEQYQKVMGTNPSDFKGPQNPVEQVSWNDAVEFCRKLSEQPEEKAAGYAYRLPTEAEWEYACRAETTSAFSFGDNVSELGDYAWFCINSGDQPIDALKLWLTGPDNLVKHALENNLSSHAVGRKASNSWGLYDMLGNVWEWCQDWRGAYPSGAVAAPEGPPSGSFRIVRGGCWMGASGICRSARRSWRSPDLRTLALGFRVLRSSIK